MSKWFSAMAASGIVAVALVAVFAGPAPAAAGAIEAELALDKRRSVLFVHTSLPRTQAERVHLNVLAPTPDGGREMWQWCRLAYVGPGTYRCGIDISRDTQARTLTGEWAAKLRLDGTLLDREIFTLAAL